MKWNTRAFNYNKTFINLFHFVLFRDFAFAINILHIINFVSVIQKIIWNKYGPRLDLKLTVIFILRKEFLNVDEVFYVKHHKIFLYIFNENKPKYSNHNSTCHGYPGISTTLITHKLQNVMLSVLKTLQIIKKYVSYNNKQKKKWTVYYWYETPNLSIQLQL